MICENLFEIKEKIQRAAEKTGRTMDDIMLVAVTKSVDATVCRELLELGENTFGENRVQSLLDKYESIGSEAIWHLIGHLQTNKVKYIIDKVSLIHSVDSVHLAREIDRLCGLADKTQDILLQVNVSGEESKFGMDESEFFTNLDDIAGMSNIRVRGLMTIPPLLTKPGGNKKYFNKLYELFLKVNTSYGDNIIMDYLSMGMSDDFEEAIEEGANIVRIGRALYF